MKSCVGAVLLRVASGKTHTFELRHRREKVADTVGDDESVDEDGGVWEGAGGGGGAEFESDSDDIFRTLLLWVCV